MERSRLLKTSECYCQELLKIEVKSLRRRPSRCQTFTRAGPSGVSLLQVVGFMFADSEAQFSYGGQCC